MTHDMEHMNYLRHIAEKDIDCLIEKERTYQGSWKRRGGVGAFMMCARKWDRLEIMMQERKYDIIEGMLVDSSGKDGSVLAEVRDLRRYLLLIEAECVARKIVVQNEAAIKPPQEFLGPGTPEDGGHHAKQDGGRFAHVPSNGMKPPKPIKIERLDDGYDISPPGLQHLYVASGKYFIVDRRHAEPAMWEHLARLNTELNSKEYDEAMPEYKGLYRWNGADNKWVLQPQFVEHWGK